MSQITRSRIQSIALVVSIVCVSMVLGIALSGKVIPDPARPLMTEGLSKGETPMSPNQAPPAAIGRTSSDVETLQIEVTQLQQKGKQTISGADKLISQSSPAGINGRVDPRQNLRQRIQDIKSRLSLNSQ